jgi:hypothetical protein
VRILALGPVGQTLGQLQRLRRTRGVLLAKALVTMRAGREPGGETAV